MSHSANSPSVVHSRDEYEKDNQLTTVAALPKVESHPLRIDSTVGGS